MIVSAGMLVCRGRVQRESEVIHLTAEHLIDLSDLLRLNDAGQKALLSDWLHGCYTSPSLEEALAARGQLQPGEAIYVKSGHAVTAHSVSFYAQDTEQAGLLARQQEIENLEKQLRAQSLIHDEARAALVRAEAAYTDASQRLTSARREAGIGPVPGRTLSRLSSRERKCPSS